MIYKTGSCDRLNDLHRIFFSYTRFTYIVFIGPPSVVFLMVDSVVSCSRMSPTEVNGNCINVWKIEMKSGAFAHSHPVDDSDIEFMFYEFGAVFIRAGVKRENEKQTELNGILFLLWSFFPGLTLYHIYFSVLCVHRNSSEKCHHFYFNVYKLHYYDFLLWFVAVFNSFKKKIEVWCRLQLLLCSTSLVEKHKTLISTVQC